MFYFAYGSNMFPQQMQARCPESQRVSVGLLRDWGFMINQRGVATLMKMPGARTFGVVFHITMRDMAALDIHEGVFSGHYGRFVLPVQTNKSGTERRCLVYIDPTTCEGHPRVGYLEKIIAGAEHHHLPRSYIKQLKTWSRNEDCEEHGIRLWNSPPRTR